MNFNSLSRGLHKVGFKLKQNAPAILKGLGVASIGYGAYRLIKDSPKMEPVLEEAKQSMEHIHSRVENDENYTRKERVTDTLRVYGKAAVGTAKAVGPGLASIGVGTGCLLEASHIVEKDNKSLKAFVATQTAEIARIREAAKEKLGGEEAEKLFNGIQTKEYEKTETDENGNEVVTRETKEVLDQKYLPSGLYIYDETQFAYYRNDPWNYVQTELMDMRTKLERKWIKRGWISKGEILEFLGYTGPLPSSLFDEIKKYDPYISLDDRPLFHFTRQDVEVVYKNGHPGVEERIVIDLNQFVHKDCVTL